MLKIVRAIVNAALVGVIMAGCASAPELQSRTASQETATLGRFVPIPKDKDNDLKLYLADGRIAKGADALSRMQKEADVILWLAGNQFFAMDDVVKAFQQQNRDKRIGLITLPPGLLLAAIENGGWTYQGATYPGLPDIYASVNLGHLRKLKQIGVMNTYAIYMHNEMEIMVAKGNPKKIRGIKDLARSDVRTSMPNPVNEGIMQFYGRKVLERHGIWNQISDGKECFSCQTTPNNWFTSVHHRETPERIRDGRSDAGIVWKTETLEAISDGAQVDSVSLPPEDSLRNEVSYAIGVLVNSTRRAVAERYLQFLSTREAQAAYAKFGFVNGTADDLKLKPIP